MKKLKTFITAFLLSLCVLGLAVGLCTAGYNSRRMAQGDSAPHGSYRLQNGELLLTDRGGRTYRLAPLDETRTETALVPAPLRGALYALRALTAAAEKVVSRYF